MVGYTPAGWRGWLGKMGQRNAIPSGQAARA